MENAWTLTTPQGKAQSRSRRRCALASVCERKTLLILQQRERASLNSLCWAQQSGKPLGSRRGPERAVGRQWQTAEGELKEGPLYNDELSHHPQRAVPGPLHQSPGQPQTTRLPGPPPDTEWGAPGAGPGSLHSNQLSRALLPTEV